MRRFCDCVEDYMLRFMRFNTFFCGLLVLLLAAGCRTHKADDADKDKKDKKDKEATVLELHMEMDPDSTASIIPVTVGKEAAKFRMNVESTPFLDNGDLDWSDVVVDSDGLFAIRLKFNRRGTELLDTFTSMYPGKRVAVFCRFGAGEEHHRYIAAPNILRPISNGVFTFTPSTTREEADRIVRGLNAVAEQIKKDDTFP